MYIDNADIGRIAGRLKYDPGGIWFSEGKNPVDYPEDGHQHCFQVEADSFWFGHRNACLLEVLSLFPPKGSLLDIGGGNGFVSAAMQRAGWDVILVEPGRSGVFNAKRRGVEKVICAAFQQAGFLPHSIPGCGLFDVLEHIENDFDFLHTIQNTLVPGGRLFITVPAYNALHSTEDDYSGHYRRYTLAGLHKKLTACGFLLEYQTYIFSFLPPLILLFRSIPGRLGLRTGGDTRKRGREHRASSKLVRALLHRVLSWEVAAVHNKKRIPVGGSCLVVARTPTSPGFHHPRPPLQRSFDLRTSK